MTISLPGSSKKGLSGLLSRQKRSRTGKAAAKKKLDGLQVAKLFDKQARAAKPAKPAKLNEIEQQDSARLTSLRGALYSDK